MEQHWKIHVMGVRGSWPVSGAEFAEFGTATSCYILKRGSHAVIVDCGSGLGAAKRLLADCESVDVLLTHVHYDHLIGLLAWGVFPPAARLRFYAQFINWFGQDTLKHFFSAPFWPYTPEGGELIEVGSPGSVELEDGVAATFCPSNHPNGASIVRVDTPDGSVCAAFDYEHLTPFPKHMAEGCELLMYDSMYTSEEYPQRVGWGHSCWEKGCEAARMCGVERLMFAHHDPQKTDEVLRELEREAQKEFSGARFLREGDVIDLRKKGGTSR